MTPSVDGDPNLSVRPRRRLVRLTALGVTVGVAAATIVGATGGTAAAAATPNAQSVGRFVDGSVGGMPIQSLADLVDARAKAAPDTSSRNPLEAKLLGQLDVPLGSALQLPGGGALNLGVANQLAEARTTGYSYGAAGAVANTGGVDLTDKQGDYPSDATIDLSSDLIGKVAIPGLPTALPPLPTGTPGASSLAALGGVKATVGAVRALAQTKTGGKVVTPQSSVANVKLTLGSPALGGVLAQLKGLLNPSTLSGVLSGIPSVPGITLPTGCALTATAPDNIYLDSNGKKATAANSVVTIDVTNATISINVGALVTELLGKDISDLNTSNFDLIDFLVTNLPKILSTGLANVVTGITDPLQAQFTACTGLINNIPVLGPITTGLIAQLVAALNTGKTTLLGAISGLSDQFSTSAAGPLGQLAGGLKNVVDIGLNVQSGPGIEPRDTKYPFTTQLDATPDQATPVVKNQTLVRAIEIDVLSLAGLPAAGGTLPGLPSLPTAGTPSTGAVLALANAAAGPSSSTAVAPSSASPAPSNAVANDAIPTGVPAGAAGHTGGGSPALPIVVVLIGLVLAGGGVTAYRFRGKLSH